MACKICFCPAHRLLSPRYREILRQTAPDWHTFGILITECHALELFFNEVEKHTRRIISVDQVIRTPKGVEAVRALYDLVVSWPFRWDGFPLGTYFLGDNHVKKEPVDYASIHTSPSHYDHLYFELASIFKTAEELERAERLIDEVLGLFENMQFSWPCTAESAMSNVNEKPH
jgi:hypothetical protein